MYIRYSMTLRNIIIAVTIVLAAIDQVFKGVVSTALVDIWENNSVLVGDITCRIGYMIFSPTTDLYGYNVPSPSYVNVFAAFILATFFIIVIEKWSPWPQLPFRYKILLLLGIWIGIKALAYSMMLSVEGCTTWAEEKYGTTNSLYNAGSVLGSVWIFLKYIMNK